MSNLNILEEAERAVLGLILSTSGKIIDDLHLTGEDFYEPSRGDLYTIMVRMWEQGHPVDAYTMADANPEQSAFLFSLTSIPASVSSGPYYAELIRKHALRRRLAAVGSGLATLDSTLDSTAVADMARQLVDDAIGTPSQPVKFVKDILPGLVDRLTAKKVFVPSPWPSLNRMIGGFRPGAVYVIAARPGQGKTLFAGQIAVQLAEFGMVAFSSLEMTDEELVARMVAERLQIHVGHIKDSMMDSRDWERFRDGRAGLESLNIAIDDRSGVSAGDVRAFARAVSRSGPLSAVIVDYMQLMVSKQRTERHLQVADFSRQLKIMAKDLNVPVIALSQLNRNSESSMLAVPKLSDLRESGAIEQDADLVLLLRREGESPNEELVVDVAKNRHGSTGEFRLSWQGNFSRAVEWDYSDGGGL